MAGIYTDYFAAAGGLFVCGYILLTPGVVPVLFAIAIVLCILFGVFAVQTLRRQRLRLTLTGDKLSVEPRGGEIVWSQLNTLKLDYFSTRRDGENGWMQLTLEGNGTTVSVDSRLQGFDELIEHAVRAARTHSLELGETTRSNIAGLDRGAMGRPMHNRGERI